MATLWTLCCEGWSFSLRTKITFSDFRDDFDKKFEGKFTADYMGLAVRLIIWGPYYGLFSIEIRYELLKKSKRGRKDRGMKSPPPKPRQPQASEGHISYHGFVRVMKLFMKMPRGKLMRWFWEALVHVILHCPLIWVAFDRQIEVEESLLKI